MEMYRCRSNCPNVPLKRENILKNIENFKRIISDNQSRIKKSPLNLFRQQYQNFQDEFDIINKCMQNELSIQEPNSTELRSNNHGDILLYIFHLLEDIFGEVSKLHPCQQTNSSRNKTSTGTEFKSLITSLCEAINEFKTEIKNFSFPKESYNKTMPSKETGTQVDISHGKVKSERQQVTDNTKIFIGKIQHFLKNEKVRCLDMDKQLKCTKEEISELMKDLLIKSEDVSKQCSEANEEENIICSKCHKLEEEIRKLKVEKEKITKELARSKKSIQWNMNERSEALLQIKNLRKQNEILKNQISNIEMEKNETHKNIDKWVETSKEHFDIPLQKPSETDHSEIKKLKKKIASLQKQIEIKNNELKSLKQSNLEKEKRDIELSRNKYEIEIKAMSAKVEQLTREIRVIEDGKNFEIREIRQIYQQKIDTIVAKHQESQIKLEEQTIINKELEKELEVQRKSSFQNEKVVTSLETEIQNYALLIEEKERRIQSSSEQISLLERQINELHEYESVQVQSINQDYHNRILEMRQNIACEKLELEKQYCELQEKLSALQIIYRKSEHQLEITEAELHQYRDEISNLQSQHHVTKNKLTWLTQSIHETLNVCEESINTSDIPFGMSWDSFEPVSDLTDNDEEVILVRRLQSRLKAEYDSQKERVSVEAHMQNKIDQLKLNSNPSDEKISDDSTDYAINDGVLSRCDEEDDRELESNKLNLQRSLSKFEMFPKSKSVDVLRPSKSAIKKTSVSHDSALKQPTTSSYRSLVISKSSLEVIHEDVKDTETEANHTFAKNDGKRNENVTKNPFDKNQEKNVKSSGNEQNNKKDNHAETNENQGNLANPFITEEQQKEKPSCRRERRVSFDADNIPEHVLIRGRRSSDGSNFDFNHFINRMEETKSFESCKKTPSLPKTKSTIRTDSNDFTNLKDEEHSTINTRYQKIASSAENLKDMISSYRQSDFVAIIEGSADEDAENYVIRKQGKVKNYRHETRRKQYATPLKAIPVQSSAEVILSSNSSVYPNSCYSMDVNPFDSDSKDDIENAIDVDYDQESSLELQGNEDEARASD